MSNWTKITVYNYRVFVWLIALTALMFSLSPAAAQSEVTVHQPVNGLFVRGINVNQFGEETGVVDTAVGTWSVVQTSTLLSINPRPLWSPDGQEIAIRFVGEHAGVVSFPDNSIVFTTQSIENGLDASIEMVTYPSGWSSDSNALTMQYATTGGTQYLTNIDLTTNIAQEIRHWQTNAQVTDMPLPPNATSVQLEDVTGIDRNPVFDDWFLMQFGGRGYYSTFDVGEPANADINVLWNFRTNQYISLDALVPNLSISISPGDWSHDGTRLLLQAHSKDLREPYLLTFYFTPDVGVTLMGQAVVDNRTIQHWLDAGDLFFSLIQDYEGGAAYVLGEIVNGEYRETPFFSLNGDPFDFPSPGDWFMQADEAERHRLSCLFEWSLPARFGVGDRARVNFTDGTPLRLREAPEVDAVEIMQLPEGTEFGVIGGSACVNTGDDHYRFWQIQLDDNTVGWAAEASMTDYFMEPLPDIVPPTANAGTYAPITDTNGDGSEVVTLDGQGSTDDGTIVSYSWGEGSTHLGDGATPPVTLTVGTHTIMLTVTDNDGATDTDEVVITVNAAGTTTVLYRVNAGGSEIPATPINWTAVTMSDFGANCP